MDSDLAEEVNGTLEDLSQTIQCLTIHDDFSQILLKERLDTLQCASMYLSAALMDCLTAIIGSLPHSGGLLVLKRQLTTCRHQKSFISGYRCNSKDKVKSIR